MLSDKPVIAFIPTTDAARARSFYEDILGLRFVNDDGFALVMEGNGTTIRIVRTGDFLPQPFTILGWEVEDIETIVPELTIKGLDFTRYDFIPQSPAGIWTAPGGSKVAWFKDPDGNTLSVSQHPK